MKSSIKFVKTLPHLNEFFIDKTELTIYTNINSPYTYKFLEEITLFKKNEITFNLLVNFLSKTQYQRVEAVSQINEFTIKGDSIVIWPTGYFNPLKLEFFGEDLEKIYSLDINLNKKIEDVDFLCLSSFSLEDKTEVQSVKLYIPKNLDLKNLNLVKIIFSASLLISSSQDFNIISTDFVYAPIYYSRFDILQKEIESFKRNNYNIFINTNKLDYLPMELVEYTHSQRILESKPSKFTIEFLNNVKVVNPAGGFISKDNKLVFLTDRELFGSIFLEKRDENNIDQTNIERLLKQFEGNIEVGDYIVHQDYGVGIYSGLTREEVDQSFLEYLELTYYNNDKLLVPLHQINKITKYIGFSQIPPKLTKLGKGLWESTVKKLKVTTKLLAKELVEHYALREIAKADAIKNSDSLEYLEFCNKFPFNLTLDQKRAVNEIVSDLEKPKPMNRLLIGDVGFGKTEVFIRAAFKIVENGMQVAVLSPTTILTAQHYALFKERFKDSKFKIAYLSRFNSSKQNREIIDKLNEGKIDVVIGTHRLLSSDIKFKKLGLLVIDEEQRFGVKQKEKVKKINYGTHVLNVSATPIPRTLSMALSSIQDISIISEPPKDRKPIHTEIIKDDWNKIVNAISLEVNRGGQVYFVHNQINTIQSIKAKLESMLPGIRFIIGHGQMSGVELDRVMTDFFNKKFDCLIATTIIENGLDLPNVNTMIINDAHKFGLSQLYQLRGRVGRSTKDAFCYLAYSGKSVKDQVLEQNILDPKLKKEMYRKYIERLKAIVENQDLGAGFRVASKDLEIRGSGNLLGEEQSGFIATTGYAMYIQLLAQEIDRIKKMGA